MMWGMSNGMEKRRRWVDRATTSGLGKNNVNTHGVYTNVTCEHDP